MTTALLHPALRRDTDRLVRVCAASFAAAGVILLPVPELVARVFQLDGASDIGLRVVGATWIAFGMALAVAVGRAVGRRVAGLTAGTMIANAVFLLGAPYVLGLEVGWFGWIALFLLALLSGTGGLAWFFVFDRIRAHVAREARRVGAAASLPPNEVQAAPAIENVQERADP